MLRTILAESESRGRHSAPDLDCVTVECAGEPITLWRLPSRLRSWEIKAVAGHGPGVVVLLRSRADRRYGLPATVADHEVVLAFFTSDLAATLQDALNRKIDIDARLDVRGGVELAFRPEPRTASALDLCHTAHTLYLCQCLNRAPLAALPDDGP